MATSEFVTTVQQFDIPGLGKVTFASADRPLTVMHMRDTMKLSWDEIGLRIGRDERTARRRYRKEKLALTRKPDAVPSEKDGIVQAIKRAVNVA